MKRRDSDSSSSGEEGFIRHGVLTKEYRARKRQKVGSELERFTEYTPIKAEQKIVNQLEYWKGIKHKHPILFRMAMDIFFYTSYEQRMRAQVQLCRRCSHL
jgi:hypothetical protein